MYLFLLCIFFGENFIKLNNFYIQYAWILIIKKQNSNQKCEEKNLIMGKILIIAT